MMPERVEATVKAVEEVLAELVKVDTAVVKGVKEVVTEKLEVAVEVVKKDVPVKGKLLLSRWSRKCLVRRLKLPSSRWSKKK